MTLIVQKSGIYTFTHDAHAKWTQWLYLILIRMMKFTHIIVTAEVAVENL